MTASSSERAAWLVVLAGVVAALQVGKLPPALPALQAELGLTLVQSGFLVSLVQMAGMLLGLSVGLAGDTLGHRRCMLAGLLTLSAGGVEVMRSIERDDALARCIASGEPAVVLAELVRINNLSATPDQVRAHIEDMAQSYEKPSEVVSWYLGDKQRMADVEVVVVENNVAEFVMSRGKVIDKDVPFDELMAS